MNAARSYEGNLIGWSEDAGIANVQLHASDGNLPHDAMASARVSLVVQPSPEAELRQAARAVVDGIDPRELADGHWLLVDKLRAVLDARENR